MTGITKSLIVFTATALVGMTGYAGTCGSAQPHTHSKADAAGDLVSVAENAGSFNTLVAAVKAAGLVDVLKGDGPYTVFAPTDEAFSKLPEGTVESLLLPENKDRLVSILTYHVVPGKVNSADVAGLDSADTVQGQKVTISVDGETVTIDGARVVKADVDASNGIIHVIDTVILPTEG